MADALEVEEELEALEEERIAQQEVETPMAEEIEDPVDERQSESMYGDKEDEEDEDEEMKMQEEEEEEEKMQEEEEDEEEEEEDERNKENPEPEARNTNISNSNNMKEKKAPAVVQAMGDKAPVVRAQYNLGKAIREAASGNQLTGLEAEMSQEAALEFRNAGIVPAGNGIHIPTMMLRADEVPMATAALVDSSDDPLAANVGQAIATEIQGPVAKYRPDTIADALGVRLITGVTGDISIPVQTANVTAGKTATEIAAVDSSNIALSSVNLSPERFAAHTKVTQQLLAQNSFDLDSFLAADIRQGLALAYNAHLVTAIGGITAVDAEASGALVNTVDVPFLLESQLRDGDVPYEQAKFLTDATAFRAMRQAALDAGSGLFAADGRNSIIGYDTVVNSAVTNGSVYMMNPADLVCAEWGGISLIVDQFTEAEKGIVRIIGAMYADCKVLRNAGVKGYTNVN
jgi:HK97 family phage major capsid protein